MKTVTLILLALLAGCGVKREENPEALGATEIVAINGNLVTFFRRADGRECAVMGGKAITCDWSRTDGTL